jgi:hypothetical protein
MLKSYLTQMGKKKKTTDDENTLLLQKSQTLLEAMEKNSTNMKNVH